MDGKLKVLENYFLVGTTKSIFMDGTNKTLQQAIDDGSLGGSTTATTSGRGYTQVKLRGARVYITDVPTSQSAITKIAYTFPTGDLNRERRLFIWTPTGGRKSIDIPDGTLELNQALVYNVDTNTLTTKSGTWGNVLCDNNELLLLYNDRGVSTQVGGLLSPYIRTHEQPITEREIKCEQVSMVGNGLSQGIFIIDDVMYLFGHSSDDKLTKGDYQARGLDNLNQNIKSGSHDLGHMNAPSYSHEKDMLIVGNGSKVYDQSSFPMSADIYYNFKSVLSTTTDLVWETLDKTVLDLSMFEGEYKAQVCWGYGDNVYLLTTESRIVRRLRLGKGTEQLSNGQYTETTSDRYNGTFEVQKTWRTTHSGIIGGMTHYQGELYIGIKGEYGIRKMSFTSDGTILLTDLKVNGQGGTMQGLDIKDGIMYAFTDSRGYKILLEQLK